MDVSRIHNTGHSSYDSQDRDRLTLPLLVMPRASQLRSSAAITTRCQQHCKPRLHNTCESESQTSTVRCFTKSLHHMRSPSLDTSVYLIKC
eukprot:5618387-Amphidinium_carterae.1